MTGGEPMAHQFRAVPHSNGSLTERPAVIRQTDSLPTLVGSHPESVAIDIRDAARVIPGMGTRPAMATEVDATPAVAPPLVAEAIAHELRSTLALISGYSQTVRHLPLDNDVRFRYLERITSASLDLTELTEEMLAIAADPRRAAEPSPETISLRHLYAHLARRAGEGVDSPPIAVDAPADLPLVEADPIWIALVVRNLVTNAAKYANGSRVSLRAWQSGAWVVTRVSDGGAGIEPEERERLFEPHYRGGRARASGSPGSGLGLYLCRRLVEAHGGRIWVDETGEGLSVCFSLPRGQRPAVAVGPGKGRPAAS